MATRTGLLTVLSAAPAWTRVAPAAAKSLKSPCTERRAPARLAALLLLGLLLLPGVAGEPALAAGMNEFLPRDVPALKRFSIVAATANNQCITTQLIRNDPKRVLAMALLSPCEFGLDNQTQGFFISRPLVEHGYQIFFAANPSYCLAMEPRARLLVVSGCALDNQMLEDLPQLWDIRGGGLSLKDSTGKRWCLDTRAKQGFSMLFEPYFTECQDIIPDYFIMRVSR